MGQTDFVHTVNCNAHIVDLKTKHLILFGKPRKICHKNG